MNANKLVVLCSEGQSVTVKLDGTDGEFTIFWDEENEKLTVTADMADSYGRIGVIYQEDFSYLGDVGDEISR